MTFPRKVPRVLLLNDTRASEPPHMGCFAAMDAIERWIDRSGGQVTKRVPVHALRGLWQGSRQELRSAFDADERIQRMLTAIDAVVLNAEGSIHDGQGLELLGVIDRAQALGLPTAIVNASLQDAEQFIDTIARAGFVHAREAQTSKLLTRFGIRHVHAPDAIVAAGFAENLANTSPAGEARGKVVITDAHESRAAAFATIAKHVRDAFAHECVTISLENERYRDGWRSAIAELASAKCVVTARHHGVYAALLAGVPVVAFAANTAKIEATFATLGLENARHAKFLRDYEDVSEAMRSVMQHADEAKAYARKLAATQEHAAELAMRSWMANVPDQRMASRAKHVVQNDVVEGWTRSIVGVVGMTSVHFRAPDYDHLDERSVGYAISHSLRCGGCVATSNCEHDELEPKSQCLFIVARDEDEARSLAGLQTSCEVALILCRSSKSAYVQSERALASSLQRATPGHEFVRHPRLDRLVSARSMSREGHAEEWTWFAFAKCSESERMQVSSAGSSVVSFAFLCRAIDAIGNAQSVAIVCEDDALAHECVKIARLRVPASRIVAMSPKACASLQAHEAFAAVVSVGLPTDAERLAMLARALQPAGRLVLLAPEAGLSIAADRGWPALLQAVATHQPQLLPERVLAVRADGETLDAVLTEDQHLDTPFEGERWGLVCVKDPVGHDATNWVDPSPASVRDNPAHTITRFAEDYANPWLVRGIVSVDERSRNPHVLRDIAQRASEVALAAYEASGRDFMSKHLVDLGACLCVLGYAELAKPKRSTLDREPQRDCVRRISQYLTFVKQSPRPHALRWRVSCMYVLGLLQSDESESGFAQQTFAACAEIDPRPFSPLLGTKTIDSMIRVANAWADQGNMAEARRWWLKGASFARELMQGDWLNITGPLTAREGEPPAEPLAFGMREAAEILLLGTKCALALRESERRVTAPAIAAELMRAETFAEIHADAQRVWKQKASLEQQLATERQNAAQEREKLLSWNASLQAEKQWLSEQAATWNAKTAQLEQEIARQREWIERLQQDHAWATREIATWRGKAQQLEDALNKSEAWATSLKQDVSWNSQQRAVWEQRAISLEQALEQQKAWSSHLQTQLTQVSADKAWLVEHRQKIEAELAKYRDRAERGV